MTSSKTKQAHQVQSLSASQSDPAVHRKKWIESRADLERSKHKVQPYKRPKPRQWDHFATLAKLLGAGLRFLGLEKRGVENAYNIKLTCIELSYANLPQAFDGYRLLHLTDLHFDRLPKLTDIIHDRIGHLPVDLAVMTGDYRDLSNWHYSDFMAPLKKMVESIESKDGIVATLGNHDSIDMLLPMERLGIRVLGNETIPIERKGERIFITGLDDVHYYYTDKALEAISAPLEGFKVALVHSAELYEEAEKNGYSLYLAGHSHGGQICLPGGIPFITHTNTKLRYAKGLWKHENLYGYTSNGVGTVTIPMRFFSQGEIVVITLRRSNSLSRK